MKKKIVAFTSCILLICVLATVLTSCMKIGMRQSSVEKRLREAGASISYMRSTPMTGDGVGYRFNDLIHSTKAYVVNSDGVESEVERELYVIFADDDASAQKAYEACKTYIESQGDALYKWNCYIYERVVLCGYYELLAVARNY